MFNNLIVSHYKCAVSIVKYYFVHNFIVRSNFKTWSNIVRQSQNLIGKEFGKLTLFFFLVSLGNPFRIDLVLLSESKNGRHCQETGSPQFIQ